MLGSIDISALATCARLESLQLPWNPVNVSGLRRLPSLSRIGWQHRGAYAAEEFWRRYSPATDSEHPAVRALLTGGVGVVTLGLIEVESDGSLKINARRTRLSDLRPLTGLNISWLDLNRTWVRDLSALSGMSLRFLDCGETDVNDAAPLLNCPTLESVVLPEGVLNGEKVRSLPKLHTLHFVPRAEHREEKR
jgi:hypothetical protein